MIDDEKLDVKRYMMLLKRSSQPVGDAINKITNLTIRNESEKIGVDILSCGYLHGRYDWVIIFTAKDIKNAKKLSEILIAEYPQLISEVEIMEYVFTLKEGGIVNPEIDKLKEFF